MEELTHQREEIDKLRERRAEIERLKELLDGLRRDLEYANDGGEVFYAVDFREIHSYLHFDPQRAVDILTAFGPQPAEVVGAQHSVVLKHLFNHLAPTLYLLPSYQQELTAYARARRSLGLADQDERARLDELSARAHEILNGLPDEERELLRAASGGDSLSHEQRKRLVNFLGQDFLVLSASISDLFDLHKDARRLKKLIESGKLSYNLASILGGGILRAPSDDEEMEVFNAFPGGPVKRNPFAKLLDARAMITLRDVNQIFDHRRRKARLLLVTRDRSIHEAAERLSEWFPVTDYLRGMEAVLFHSILHAKPDYDQRVGWLHETMALLDDLLGNLDDFLSKRAKFRADRPSIVRLERRVLKNAGNLWNKYINVQVNPLEEGTLTTGVGDIYLKEFRDIYEFVSTPEYRRLAETADNTLWDWILEQPYYLMFITYLGEKGTDRVSRLLAEVFTRQGGEVKTVLRSMTASLMPSMQFTSKRFERLLKNFTLEDAARQGRPDRLSFPIFNVITEITGGLSEPENFLFLAYILGMLGLWEDALALAERSAEMYGEYKSAEVTYLLAFLTRRMAENEELPGAKLEKFLRANELTEEALRIKMAADGREDPRYLKLMGTIILLYHDGLKSHAAALGSEFDAPPRSASIGSVESGKELLKQARSLIQDDIRLEMEIINNLAYMEVLSEAMDARAAEAYLLELKAKLEEAGKEKEYEIYCETIYPFFKDTCVMVEARKAKDRHDLNKLRKCLKSLEAILEKKNLMQELKNATREHIELVKKWVQEAEQRGLPLE